MVQKTINDWMSFDDDNAGILRTSSQRFISVFLAAKGESPHYTRGIKYTNMLLNMENHWTVLISLKFNKIL